MDLFRFTNPTAPSRMERGVLVEDVDSKLWVERYREAGEFEVVAGIDTGIRSKLPIGAFVSHVDTDEIMIVENHSISDDDEGGIPAVSVTGRGFESFFEQRVVGSNRSFPTSGALPDYTLASNPTWVQAVSLIKRHIQASELIDDANAIPYFDTVTTASGDGEIEARTLDRGSLYEALMQVLAVDDLGIRIMRPGRGGDLASDPANSVIEIHRGVDRSATVMFSHEAGDVESADYLWSNKSVKNAAYIRGRWVDTQVFLGPATSGFKRRWMSIDMSDLDQSFSEAPTGDARILIEAAMQIRGRQILAAQAYVALSRVEISKEAQTAAYRTDYGLGDLVAVTGNFSEQTVMRVTEHVEIEDEDGSRSYPTLSASEEEDS